MMAERLAVAYNEVSFLNRLYPYATVQPEIIPCSRPNPTLCQVLLGCPWNCKLMEEIKEEKQAKDPKQNH